MKYLLFIFLHFLTSSFFAQTVLFSENFDDESFLDTTGVSNQGVSWSASCPYCLTGDIFNVNSFGNITKGLRGNDTNGPANFTASGIDATGMHVIVLEFDYECTGYLGSGNLECNSECSFGGTCSGDPANILMGSCFNCWDFLSWEMNTGAFSDAGVVLGNDCNVNSADHVISVPSCAGPYDNNGNLIPGNDPSNLSISLTMAMWASTENMIIDNLSVIGFTKLEAISAGYLPNVGNDTTIELCTDLGTDNLFNYTSLGTTQTGYWIGPSSAGGGHLGTIDLSSFIPGDYSYIASSSNGCLDTATISVIEQIEPNAEVIGNQDICDGETITVQASGNGNIEWSNGSQLDSLTISYPGNYFLIASNNCGVDTNFFTISSLGAPPIGSIDGDFFVCDSLQPTSITASGGISYFWQNGNSSDVDFFYIPQQGYVLISNQCGSDSLSFEILDESVTASFSVSDSIGEPPLTVAFSNSSSNASVYFWDFGDGTVGNLTNPVVEYNMYGDFLITLVASNAVGCSDTAYSSVSTVDTSIEVPNVFSPNGDLINDLFIISEPSIENIKGQVYNRWGQLLHEAIGPSFFWDGISSAGLEVPAGCYFFSLEILFKNQQTAIYSGQVTIIR